MGPGWGVGEDPSFREWNPSVARQRGPARPDAGKMAVGTERMVSPAPAPRADLQGGVTH